MAPLADDPDVKAVGGAGEGAGPDTEGARREVGAQVHAVQLVYPHHHTGLQHFHRAAGRQLLRMLEQEPHLALEAGPLRRKQLSCRKLHGRMAIVAAGMHDTGHCGGIGQPRLLLNGKRVNIRPQGQYRTGLGPFQHRYHACFGGKFQRQTRDLFQFLRQVSRCMDLLKGKLRVLMHMAPPSDYIRLQRQDLF